MFGIYTEEARSALDLAAKEALSPDWALGGWVFSEHLVLALLSMPDGEGAGPRILRRLGVTREDFSSRLRGWPPEEPEKEARRPRVNAPMHLILERSLQLALDLRRERTDAPRVGTGHLLLGLLYERGGGGTAERALEELGATYETVRKLLVDAAVAGEEAGPPDEALPLAAVPAVRKTQSAARIFKYARQQARQDRAYKGRVGTHHYLLACAMDMEGDMLAARVLKSFGLSYAVIKARAEELLAEELMRGPSIEGPDMPGPMAPPPPTPLVVEDLDNPPEGIPEGEIERLREIQDLYGKQEEEELQRANGILEEADKEGDF